MSDEAIYKLHRHGDTLEEFEYVQELVRCKECRFNEDDYCICVSHKVMPMHFCSYGERREQ